MTDKKTEVRSTEEALKLALEALTHFEKAGLATLKTVDAITAIREALAEQPAQQEPVREMPSNTRYAVAVEGQALTYWDNIHDAITNAQRAVYAGPNETSRAIDDLKAGRLAEWSYGFSAVRIYPPQNTSPPASKPWVGLTEEDIEAAMPSGIYDCLADPWDCGVGDGDYMRSIKNDVVRIVRAIEAKLKEKNHDNTLRTRCTGCSY